MNPRLQHYLAPAMGACVLAVHLARELPSWLAASLVLGVLVLVVRADLARQARALKTRQCPYCYRRLTSVTIVEGGDIERDKTRHHCNRCGFRDPLW